MDELGDAVWLAATMLRDMDADLVEIVLLSLQVSLTAVIVAAVLGVPLGAFLALRRFPGRRVATVVLNALMGLPPVVVGLTVYLMLSRSGPLGVFGLLFTPTAMIIAQVILVLPIIASLSRDVVATLWDEYNETLRSLSANWRDMMAALLWDGRYMLITALLAGFGRAIAEVGAVMIVGGNIDHATRVMTTAIALETSKGNLALALALGCVLLLLSLIVNASAQALRATGERTGAS